MKRIFMLTIVYIILCSNVYAKDVTLRGLPDGLPNEVVAEYASAAVERYENALLGAEQANLAQKQPVTQIQIDGAKKAVDDFRKANSLQPKFEAKVGE